LFGEFSLLTLFCLSSLFFLSLDFLLALLERDAHSVSFIPPLLILFDG